VSDASIGPTGLRIMKLLVGRSPQTVAELIDSTDVTRTAVTEQLNSLMDAGFVERTVERVPSRGRPRHVYQATHAALVCLFPGNQRLVVPAIWQAILDVGGEKLSSRILKRVSRTLADHYKRKVTAKKPLDRLRQLLALFSEEGGLHELVETDEGQWAVHKRNCPFISMVDGRRCVCRIDQQVMSEVVGRPLQRTACRHDGAPCCTFEIVTR
jgi:DeoR family transcriptional regulator, suf operon transcriptional repressor